MYVAMFIVALPFWSAEDTLYTVTNQAISIY